MAFEAILKDLLAETGASRTTLRLDTPGRNFPAVGEALADGIRPIRRDESLDQRSDPTARRLMETHETLVQEDCASADPRPPAELIELYGVKAQMLEPIVDETNVVGWISVHYVPNTRMWSCEDVRALREAITRVRDELGLTPTSGSELG